jgi:NAD(P)-dependent dehydrogenase (short-subunit alcohol dehydrogenase family)
MLGRSTNELTGKKALVVGASRGLGCGVAEAFNAAGATVVAVARDGARLAEIAHSGSGIVAEVADATDPAVAGMLLERYQPDVLALIAGATPLLRRLQDHTWETFSANWNTDVRIDFHWLREALLLPLKPGSRVLVMSSGAALGGSPLSGGYAGSKATLRFIADYAGQEAKRAGLGISFTAVLPRLTNETELGRPAVAAYAARAGLTEAQFLAQMGPRVTAAVAGQAFVELATAEPASLALAYLLTGDGLQPLP